MSAVEEYQKAIDAYKQAKLACADMANVISRANQTLASWPTATVSNIESKFPKNLYDKPGQVINAREWPDAEKLKRTLERYHFARRDMAEKRSAIPMPELLAVIPLPD